MVTLSKTDFAKVQVAAEFIEDNLTLHLNVHQLGQKVQLNVAKLKAGFKQRYGVGPYGYLQQTRIKVAKQMLLDGISIQKTALSVGFVGEHAKTNFIKCFKKNEKVTPGMWKMLYEGCLQKEKAD